MAGSQNMTCADPSWPAVPNQNVPVMKSTCVSTRSPRRSSFLSCALWRWTSRPAAARLALGSVITRRHQLGDRGQGALIGRLRESGDDGAGLFREGLGALLRALDAAVALQDVQ